MKILKNGYIYDTKKLTLLFDLDKNKPKISRTPNIIGSTWVTTATAGSAWTLSASHLNDRSEVPKHDSSKYYIARTPKSKFVIAVVYEVKNDDGEEIEVGRDITRYFKDAEEVVDYLSERYGINKQYDLELEKLFTQIGYEVKTA